MRITGVVVGLLLLVIGGSFALGFDRGPVWTARVVGVRDALGDMLAGEPHVLVIGNPAELTDSAAALEARLGATGLKVRYTGDDNMTLWERTYVAAYWDVMGLMHDPPTG